MNYAIDTDVIIKYLRREQPLTDNLDNIMARHTVYIPQPVDYEVRRGFSLMLVPSVRQEKLYKTLCVQCPFAFLTAETWETAIYVFKTVRKKGYTIGEMDILIAAMCLEYDLVLVTNNTKDFSNIDGLRLVNQTQY